MEIDKELILKLEKLSRLNLSDQERHQIQKDLNDILVMVNKLDELDLKNIEPLLHVIDATNVVREDKIGDHLDRDEVLDNAPERADKFFKVPKVIKK